MPKVGVLNIPLAPEIVKINVFSKSVPVRAGLRRCAHTVPVRAGPAKIRAGPCRSTLHYSKIRAGSNRAGSRKT